MSLTPLGIGLNADGNKEVKEFSSTQIIPLNLVMTSTQIDLLASTQSQYLTPTQITKLTHVDVTTGIASLLGAKQDALTTLQLTALTPAQIALLTSDQSQLLNSTQIDVLAMGQIAVLQSLASTELGALSGIVAGIQGQLNGKQATFAQSAALGALTTTQMADLAAPQVHTLVSQFSTTRLEILSTVHVGALTTTQVAGLENSAALLALTVTQVNAMTATNVAGLDSAVANQLTTTQIAAFTAKQAAFVHSTEIAALTTTAMADAASAQAHSLMALSTTQIAQLSNPLVVNSIATAKLIGRGSAGTGVQEEITLGTGLSFSGQTLNASATGSAVQVTDEGVNLTTNVTLLDFVGAGVTATHSGSQVTVTIPAGGVTDHDALTNLRDGTGTHAHLTTTQSANLNSAQVSALVSLSSTQIAALSLTTSPAIITSNSFGAIASVPVAAGESVRRNVGGTAMEAYIPAVLTSTQITQLNNLQATVEQAAFFYSI